MAAPVNHPYTVLCVSCVRARARSRARADAHAHALARTSAYGWSGSNIQVRQLGRLTGNILCAKFWREFADRKLSIRNKVRNGVVLLRKHPGVVLLGHAGPYWVPTYRTLHLFLACMGSSRGRIPRPPPSLAAEEQVGHVVSCGLCVLRVPSP